MDKKAIKTLLVEDHEISRLGLRIMLDAMPGIVVVAEETSGESAVNRAIELQPDLILMDIGLPDLDGIEATRRIKDSTSCKIIVLTSHDSDEDVLAALAAGADAFCLKGVSTSQLSNAISCVLEGAVWLDPGIAKKIIQMMSAKPVQKARLLESGANPFHLSERELQILGLLVDGCSNQQMADKLFLSSETIKTHMRHVMEKLRVSDRTQAAVKAVKEGLISSSGSDN